MSDTQTWRDRDKRRALILSTALVLAKKFGYATLTRAAIAERAKISPSLITYYFGDMTDVIAEVMRQAVEREIPEIIAQGLARKHPIAKRAPVELRQRALETMQ